MLLNQKAQTQNDLFSLTKHDPRINKSLIWHKEREAARYKKIQEQKQTREMLEQYYPWGSCQHETKPRRLRNLRLEELFPHQDFEKAKRTVLGMGRPGGGAPNVNEHGRRMCRTKEDPLLRFQWGKDLRKCVDNSLRYRINKEEQAQYKRELDKLVAEKFKQKEKEHMDNLIKDQQLGYTNLKLSNNKTLGVLDRINRDTKAHTKRIRCIKNVNIVNPYTTTSTNPKATVCQLTSLRDEAKDTGIELVPLIIEKRRINPNNHLETTDVTKNGYITGAPKWVVDGQIYLRELSKQMNSKLNELKDLRMKELESTRKHFNTLDKFWGRPGHGAPRSVLKKASIDKLLYGGRLPVTVA